jgi:hypothetical protein
MQHRESNNRFFPRVDIPFFDIRWNNPLKMLSCTGTDSRLVVGTQKILRQKFKQFGHKISAENFIKMIVFKFSDRILV